MRIGKTVRHLYFKWVLFKLRIYSRLFGFDNLNCRLVRYDSATTTAALRLFGAQIGAGTVFESPLIVNTNEYIKYSHLKVGENCYIGKNVLLDLKGKISIEDNVTVSFGSSIISHTDVGYSALASLFPKEFGTVRIGRDSYLGANTTVLMNVNLGNCCLVAAGSVVVNDVEPYTIVGGVPAKMIRKIRT